MGLIAHARIKTNLSKLGATVIQNHLAHLFQGYQSQTLSLLQKAGIELQHRKQNLTGFSQQDGPTTGIFCAFSFL